MSSLDVNDNNVSKLKGSDYSVTFTALPDSEDLAVVLTYPDGEQHSTDFDLEGEFGETLEEFMREYDWWEGDLLGFLVYWGVFSTLVIEDMNVSIDVVGEDHSIDITIEGLGEFTFDPSDEIQTISDLITQLRSRGLGALSTIEGLTAEEI